MAAGSAIFFLGVGSAIAQVFGYEIEYHVAKQKLIEELIFTTEIIRNNVFSDFFRHQDIRGKV